MMFRPRRVLARAKINLSLRVLAREASGFHQIETMFCALELADEIEITPAPRGVTVEVALPPEVSGTPPDLGPVERNLAFRAATLFAQAAAADAGVHIRLVKRIPAGAGLGGGSSDAAAVLRAMNELHARPLDEPDLLRLAVRLGSDVPFFLADAPLALAWSRGERLLRLPPLVAAPVVLLVPRERVSTADAYAALDPVRAKEPAVSRVPRSWSDVAAVAHNDFEEIIFARHPHLGVLRQALQDAGAIIARMTGTGSVVFGAFSDAAAAGAAVRQFGRSHPGLATILTETRTSELSPRNE